jgi:hypothetical protein
VYGADRVARFVLGIGTKLAPEEAIAVISVNGAIGIAAPAEVISPA